MLWSSEARELALLLPRGQWNQKRSTMVPCRRWVRPALGKEGQSDLAGIELGRMALFTQNVWYGDLLSVALCARIPGRWSRLTTFALSLVIHWGLGSAHSWAGCTCFCTLSRSSVWGHTVYPSEAESGQLSPQLGLFENVPVLSAIHLS